MSFSPFTHLFSQLGGRITLKTMPDSSVRLLFFSDLHLDRSFAWLRDNPKAARKLRNRLRDTLAKIVDLADEHKVDALLCAGDLYEQELYSPDTSAFIKKSFAKICPTPVLLAPGNHDWLAPSSIYRTIDWSPNVKIFYEEEFTPEVLKDGLTIWGIGHRQTIASHNFLDGFQVDRGGVNLALFHQEDQVLNWTESNLIDPIHCVVRLNPIQS